MAVDQVQQKIRNVYPSLGYKAIPSKRVIRDSKIAQLSDLIAKDLQAKMKPLSETP